MKAVIGQAFNVLLKNNLKFFYRNMPLNELAGDRKQTIVAFDCCVRNGATGEKTEEISPERRLGE